MSRVAIQRAIISVYDKTGLDRLARALHEAGVEIVSTGSTAQAVMAAGVPVTPALVEWRLAGTSWHVAADFRDALPRVGFSSIYAAWTRENHPNVGHQLGRYRFVLARGLDTRTLPNGRYRLVVLVRDTAGNQSEASRPFTVENGV